MNRPVNIRLSSDEILLVDAAANRFGLTRSTFLREAGIGRAREILAAEAQPAPAGAGSQA